MPSKTRHATFHATNHPKSKVSYIGHRRGEPPTSRHRQADSVASLAHLRSMTNHTIATPITTWAAARTTDREVLNRAEVATVLSLDPRTVDHAITGRDGGADKRSLTGHLERVQKNLRDVLRDGALVRRGITPAGVFVRSWHFRMCITRRVRAVQIRRCRDVWKTTSYASRHRPIPALGCASASCLIAWATSSALAIH